MQNVEVRLGLVAVGVLLFLSALSQNQHKADSIRDLIETQDLSTLEEMKSYHWLSAYSSSPEDELKYAERLLNLAKKSNNREYVIKANQRIGIAHRLMGNLGKALTSLFESANNAVGDERFTPLLADTYIEISACYTQNGDSENALLYGRKTIEILRKTNRKQELALNLLNMGYDYYLIAKYDSAISFYNESEPIFKEIEMTIGLAYLIGNRALVYWKQGDKDLAKADLYKAIEMLKPLDDRYGMADYYNQLGNIYFEEGDQENAISTTMTGLEMAKQEGLKEQIRDASLLLSLLYQKAEDYKKAIRFQTQHHAYADSIQNFETTQQLANQRTEFEVGRKQVEVDLLLEQKRNSQIIMITGGIILLIVIGLALLIYSYSKAKIKLNVQLEDQKDSLITLNNTKDKFFSIISHDLRGPVSTLSGLVSVTKYFLDEKDTDKLKDMLNKMGTSVDNLVKLLDNLLHWALQQRGHFPYVPEKLDLKESLEEVADMFEGMSTSKNIELSVECEEEVHLFADKNTTSTIFRNLLNNAIKFTPVGGKIKVVTEKSEKANIAIIKFIDNGVGMPKEKLDTLFKLNDGITTRGTSGESGLGLGLQLVYDFVELNMGRIEVQSEEGKGTTFAVFLPLSSSDDH